MHCVRTCLLQIQILRTIPKHEAVYLVTIQKYYCTLIPKPLGPWESPSCRRCAETSVRRRPRRSDHFTCIQGVPKKMSVSGTVNFTRFWNITSETGETHHFMFLCFQPLPNLNSEVWQGARTLRSRCSPEESRKASSSPCLLCPSKKYTSFICIFYLSFYRALRVCYFLKQALS